MADTKLSALTATTTLVASDEFYVNDGGASRKATFTTLGAFLATATLAAGTLTTSQPLTLTQTWNDAGVTFTGFKVNVTDTASAVDSMLMNLQVGESSKVLIEKDGSTNIRGGLVVNRNGQIVLGRDQLIGWSSTITLTGTNITNIDLMLARDAANTFALRRGTNAQTANVYDTYSSSTDFHRVAIKTARATLSNVSGANVTASALIPDGAVLVGLTTKVTTGLGTTNGTTGYQVGDGSDPDRWGAITGTAAGTTSDNRDWTATTVQAFTAAQDVVVTAVGGNFDGTGVIYVSAQYLIGEAD